MSAHNLTLWLKSKGADVGVLTTAKTRDEVCAEKEENGVKVWRVWMPRLYPMYYFEKAKKWQKPIWHLQDHFDFRNRQIVANVLDAFNPNFVNIHILQGLGYNSLIEIGKRQIPTIFFLHDLGLACVRMAMFRDGHPCKRQCVLCDVSARYKARCIAKVPKLGFCSPSRSNLETLSQYFPINRAPHVSLLNANRYPTATAGRLESDEFRLLFVGRLHSTKGIQILLQAANALADAYSFTLTVVGEGPDADVLQKEYGDKSWVKFAGFIGQQEISNIMVNSDLLCIPSIWAENSPGVVIHALSLGLPVLGSDKGGIPELIEDQKNGLLVPPGDVAAWRDALRGIFDAPARLREWSAFAAAHAQKFDADYLGNEILRFCDSLRQVSDPKR